MQVVDTHKLIFKCSQNEKVTMDITCDNTEFQIHHSLNPAVTSSFKHTPSTNFGKFEFTVEKPTQLTINFNYTDDADGVYECTLKKVTGFPTGFPETAKQFGPLPQRRTFTFLL